MKKLRVMSVVGTRPEIIRLSRVLAELDRHCDHVLVHTGQNHDHELNQIFFEDLGIRQPDHFLNSAVDSSTAIETISKILVAVDKKLATVQPDALLVLGDTNSCLSVIPAKRRQIPIFHMEAGNRCFDLRVPEETNRRIVDHTADVNLTYSTIARDYLLKEGLPPDLVIKVGSPMFEVLQHYKPQIDRSDILTRLGLTNHEYFVVSAHREENIEPPYAFSQLTVMLNMLAEDYGHPIIVTTHPRTRKRIDSTNAILHPLVRLVKPLGFHDYVHLQMFAQVVLSDSGTISEESSILNFPALNLREAHERPESMEEASVMMVGLSLDRIRQGIAILSTQNRGTCGYEQRTTLPVADYSNPNVSSKVVRVIHSYTDYVNRIVWKKY